MAESIVWAVMAGGLASLVLLAAADALVSGGTGALRNLLLVSTLSLVGVVLSGLPEALFPHLPRRLGMVLQVGLGPLACGLGLRFLGMWIGGDREDPIFYRLTIVGCYGMLLSAVGLVLAAMQVPLVQFPQVLLLSAYVVAFAVMMFVLIAVRSALLGDPLARWLVLACFILGGMAGGLYLRALKVAGFGLGTWILTAVCSVVFVLIVMMLIFERTRQQRRLARLARLETGKDPVTGLVTGAKLLTDVEHALWRTGRLRGQCFVVCLYLSNLYELGDSMGRTIDNQILAATAARIRRAVGFRCLVGLYHPRCFIIVFSTERGRSARGSALEHIMSVVTEPLQVTGNNDKRLHFHPQVGMSLMTVLPDQAQALDVLNEAERQAMEHARSLSRKSDQIPTQW